MMNTEELGALEDYLTTIVTNQEEPMMVLQEEKIITLNIRAEEIYTKVYRQQNVLI